MAPTPRSNQTHRVESQDASALDLWDDDPSEVCLGRVDIGVEIMSYEVSVNLINSIAQNCGDCWQVNTTRQHVNTSAVVTRCCCCG